ncbi:DNA-binding HxlR family transcriptional regulator [Methanococcus maripaludis]|jgi:DNA-binding HxlR family transcriptional regulator|uniref:DNA-binding HxlR family transcriptional regulator n=1 Tax=Methanococcus maripaludis TaxID=39152 RepID=A0A7J9NZ74_METMI|nr:ArsR family transcriptional regulator [Methanococcus maripaludis]MBA2852989.1 DNA-binding HxlR family transcriptional regulator [Methanococcus maripaludis]
MFLKVLSEKYSKEILLLLNENDELYFNQIQKEIDVYKSNLSRTLNKLLEARLIDKKEEIGSNRKVAKSYYKLTELGRRSLKFYDLENELLNMKNAEEKENIKIHIENVGDNSLNNSFNFSSKK